MLRGQFVRMWEQKDLEMKPPLIPADYLEFMPGRPIVLPKIMKGRSGKIVSSNVMFSRLQSRYQESFNSFIHDGLEVPENANSKAIISAMTEFMNEL